MIHLTAPLLVTEVRHQMFSKCNALSFPLDFVCKKVVKNFLLNIDPKPPELGLKHLFHPVRWEPGIISTTAV